MLYLFSICLVYQFIEFIFIVLEIKTEKTLKYLTHLITAKSKYLHMLTLLLNLYFQKIEKCHRVTLLQISLMSGLVEAGGFSHILLCSIHCETIVS